jgi:hypothetical protein
MVSASERGAVPIFLKHFPDRVKSIIARSIVSLLPAFEWHAAAVRVSRLLAQIMRWTHYRTDPGKEIIETSVLKSLLHIISALGKPFPIPIRTRGAEALLGAWNHPHGIVICSVHFPLWNSILRSLVELNCSPTAVLGGARPNGKLPVWGSVVELPALPINQCILIKVQRILRSGGSVATMIDTFLGDPLNPNILKLVGSLGARAIFATTELDDNGEILVRFSNPPDPFCKSDESIRSNIKYFQARIDHVLGLSEWAPGK